MGLSKVVSDKTLNNHNDIISSVFQFIPEFNGSNIRQLDVV